MFKPPALYPNKKPRTDLVLEPSPTFNPGSSLSSPGIPSVGLHSRHGYSRHRPSVAPLHPAEFDHSRRMSLQPAAAVRPDNFSTGANQLPRPDHAYGQEPRRPSEAATVWTMPFHARPTPDPRSSHASERYSLPQDRNHIRQPSTSGYADYGPPQPQVADRDAHYNYAPSNEAPRFERSRHEQMEMAATYGRPTFPESQPAFFMPSHYDYQQGKTRKRSNLPKQSTEIMKTWFDQVSICEAGIAYDTI